MSLKIVKNEAVSSATPGQKVDKTKQKAILVLQEENPEGNILGVNVVVQHVVNVDPAKDTLNAIDTKVQAAGIKIFEDKFKS